MQCFLQFLIGLPERIASYFLWAGPLVARLVVGYVFMKTGMEKLMHLPAIIENFTHWGIPHADILAPFVSAVECFGGILLIVGLFTRIAAGALAIVMVVAIISAKAMDIDSLETLLGFDEISYFVIFFWLAVGGAGKASLDYVLTVKFLRLKLSEQSL